MIIPKSLQAANQWNLWTLCKNGKKMPFDPNMLTPSNAATACASYAITKALLSSARPYGAAEGPGFDGPGFRFEYGAAGYAPFAAIDLDGCRDPQTGEIKPGALALVKRLKSFTEISPSGTGLHIFLKTQKPPTSGCRRVRFEVYWNRRWIAITGDHLTGTPIDLEDRTELLLDIHRRVFGPPPDTTLPPVAPPTAPLVLSDDQLLSLARTAKNGERFRELFDGPVPAGDHSRLDFALVCKLLFWFAGDLDRVDRVFRQSALMRPKWLRADYRLSTLRNAARRVTEYYSPSKD